LNNDWDWRSGKIALGSWGERIIAEPDRAGAPVGSGDDRHIVTIAGSRAGKSSTVLIPNLLYYPGSVIVIDPKGELARTTAKAREERLGQTVMVLDPFGTSGLPRSTFNPLDELDQDSELFVDDVSQISDALILDAEREPHWTDAAKILIASLILYMAASGPCTLRRLWRILMGGEGKLGCPQNEDDDPADFLFCRMLAIEAFGGRVALAGGDFLGKGDKELSSIISTARVQLRFLDSDPLTDATASSPFRLSHLKTAPTTIYLCLPATRLATHARWLRLVVSLALNAMERNPSVPANPVLFVLEEFGALGYMRPIEYATGFMAGFGVKLWSVLQDLSQLKTHYPKSWETFLGNAGMIQAFGNSDFATTQHLSRLLGNTRVVETRDHFVSSAGRASGDPGRRDDIRMVPLLEPSEITLHFARETNRQLILVPGRGPVYINRMARS
jgi:type IV secretion system protein VirD4